MCEGHADALDVRAGCLTWWELRSLVDRDAEYRRPQPARAAGVRTAGQDAWLAGLVEEAQRVRAAAQAVRAVPALADDAVRQRYEEHRARVCGADFVAARQHLTDFAGKTLLLSLADHLRTLGAGALSNDDLQDALVDGLAEAYTPGLFVPDDFARLAQRLRDLAG